MHKLNTKPLIDFSSTFYFEFQISILMFRRKIGKWKITSKKVLQYKFASLFL